jgi:hypothetical protein
MAEEEEWEKPLGRLKERVEVEVSDDMIRKRMDAEECEFYDPSQDLKDEIWLRSHLAQSSGILSCPGCFAQVSYSFQPHTEYPEQYRSSVVLGCELGAEVETQTGDHFHKVICAECRTEVGLWEISTGLYHLFHVLPSSS